MRRMGRKKKRRRKDERRAERRARRRCVSSREEMQKRKKGRNEGRENFLLPLHAHTGGRKKETLERGERERESGKESGRREIVRE